MQHILGREKPNSGKDDAGYEEAKRTTSTKFGIEVNIFSFLIGSPDFSRHLSYSGLGVGCRVWNMRVHGSHA